MKAQPMRPTTWKTDLTIEVEPKDLRDMREWLDEHAKPVPSRNADVISKFVAGTLNKNAPYDGVYCRFTVNRPRPVLVPAQTGFEGKAPRSARSLFQPDSIGKQLAIGSFGLLVMLALIWTFAR